MSSLTNKNRIDYSQKGGKRYVIALLILAIIAAIFGFGGIAASIALILFWIFLALLIIGVVIRLARGSWWWY